MSRRRVVSPPSPPPVDKVPRSPRGASIGITLHSKSLAPSPDHASFHSCYECPVFVSEVCLPFYRRPDASALELSAVACSTRLAACSLSLLGAVVSSLPPRPLHAGRVVLWRHGFSYSTTAPPTGFLRLLILHQALLVLFFGWCGVLKLPMFSPSCFRDIPHYTPLSRRVDQYSCVRSDRAVPSAVPGKKGDHITRRASIVSGGKPGGESSPSLGLPIPITGLND